MKSLSTNFASTIESKELQKISTNYTELLLDSALDEGVLKDIPIVGTLVSLFKIGVSIKERFYLKKILTFLFSLKDIPLEKRKEFINNIAINDRKKIDFFEKLLYLIDRIDDADKAEIIGELFSNLIFEKLSTVEFLRLSSLVDKIYIDDLKYLEFRYSHSAKMNGEERLKYYQNIDEDIIRTSLLNNGLLTLTETPSIRRGGSSNKKFTLTKIGRQLVDNGFSARVTNTG